MAIQHFVIIVVAGLELAWLAMMHGRGIIKWEPMWVIGVCWLSYTSDLMAPDGQWAKPMLANGEYLDLQKIAGWMATCPVLILFLVSLTTHGGREASVRVVPLLVANQMMFLFGIMSAVCTGSPRWWFYAGSWIAGCYVLAASSVCFRSLYKFFGQSEAGAGGRKLVCVLSFAYIFGWSIFPIVWTFGHSGTDQLSDQACNYFQMVGDLLAKETFVALSVVLKVRYLTDTPRPWRAMLPWGAAAAQETDEDLEVAVMKSSSTHDRPIDGVPETPKTSDVQQEGQAAGRGARRGLRDRRPSLGNIAIDDTDRPDDPPFDDEGSLSSHSYSRSLVVRGMGDAASTPQAHAVAALLGRVTDMVVAHANAPENEAHWNGVLTATTAQHERNVAHARVKEYEAEVALAMQKLTRARSQMMTPTTFIEYSERQPEHSMVPRLSARVGDSSQAAPFSEYAPMSLALGDASEKEPEPKEVGPKEVSAQWLSKTEGDAGEESTPASPLLDEGSVSQSPSSGRPIRSGSPPPRNFRANPKRDRETPLFSQSLQLDVQPPRPRHLINQDGRRSPSRSPARPFVSQRQV